MISHSNGCAAWHREQRGIKTPEEKRIEMLEATLKECRKELDRLLTCEQGMQYYRTASVINKIDSILGAPKMTNDKEYLMRVPEQAKPFAEISLNLLNENTELRAELAEAKKDAERWRLASTSRNFGITNWCEFGQRTSYDKVAQQLIDAAIDAAIGE